MTDKGWNLVSVRHTTKEEMDSNLQKINKKLREYADKVDLRINKLLKDPDVKEVIDRRKNPDEVMALRFAKEKNACVVNLVYKKSDPNKPTPFDLAAEKMDITDEDKEAAREMMREYAKDKPMLVELIDPEEDRIEIGVAYLPGMLKKMRKR